VKRKEVVRGTKDFLPREAALKREFENQTVSTFLSWGYQEVVSPTFEYLEVIESGAGENIRDELFLLPDRDGRILVLRPEMTIPIARMVATKFEEIQGPLRLFYNANIFRHTEPQMGRYKEFYQLGVELIGAPGIKADAEVIGLAAEVLNQQGMEFKISLNHIGIFNHLLQQSALPEVEKEEIKRLMLKKDLVGLEKIIAGTKMEPEFQQIFLELPVLHGDEKILARLDKVRCVPGMETALSELSGVYSLVKDYGLEHDVALDFGVLRGFDYYTGIVFEGYSPRLGYPVLGGGRYDNLLGKLGNPLPATGFAVGVERVLLALQEREISSLPRYLVAGSDLKAVLAKARELRQQGAIVEVEVGSAPDPETVTVTRR
jgi:ATP phosphoribosyltransferase regulatory subunit